MVRWVASRLHLYVGLLAAIVLIPIGLTGSVLVFSHEIDEALYRHLLRVEPADEVASIESVRQRVEREHPESRITRMDFPEEEGHVIEVVLADGREVFVDPYRGTITGSHLPGETITGFLFDLHVNLLAGARGKAVVGIAGLVLILLSVTGVIIWWRGRRHLKRGLTVRWSGTPKRVNYDMHGATGVYSVLLLVLISFTGSGLVFYSTFDRAAHTIGGAGVPMTPPKSTVVDGVDDVDMDTVLADAVEELSDARLARVDFPLAPDAAFRVRFRTEGELHPIGLSMVFVDRYSGEVLRVSRALDEPAARQVGYYYYPLHIGSYGGIVVKLLYVAGGLAPVLLSITGVIIWWNRRKKRGSSRRPQRSGDMQGNKAAARPVAVPPRPSSPPRS